jgi:four helix bundle protein
MAKHNFRNLRIWLEAVELAAEIYKLTQRFSNEHKFGIANQLYRAAVSISSNIAEGSARRSGKEFRHFLCISLGSAFELETQLIIAQKCNLGEPTAYQSLLLRLNTLQKQITAFTNTIEL